MKITTCAALAALALALSACGSHRHGVHHGGAAGQPDPAQPRVLVDAKGRMSLNQEPLRFHKAQGPVTITWRLPAEGGYAFAADGIVIERLNRDGTTAGPAKDVFDCGLKVDKPSEFRCLNRNTPGEFKYTVRALQHGKPLRDLDPRIVNEFD